MEREDAGAGVTKFAAVSACIGMAVFYVALLYSPTLILRLPPPNSYTSFLTRRFCAAVSSIVSLIVASLILPITGCEASSLLCVYGIRMDHIWQALVYPLLLTAFMYSGSFALKFLIMLQTSREYLDSGGNLSVACVKSISLKTVDWVVSTASCMSSWRNYFVAPLTEELVFRACMIPLLLCGGFSTYTVIFLCPVFFSFAHMNHLLEFYLQRNYSLLKACQVVGFQLVYTVIFGAYASFLLIRTGHLTAPLIAHIFCNFMGLPVIHSGRSGMVSLVFVIGVVSFSKLLFPLTTPYLYNDEGDNCSCWHRYCSWS
ncbi:CAAX prenyl protease 2-like [Salvia splendens]|uniref:CAAX prenyl protease 2-like n=1 Tax=Salvia splendens TaxID=180675 RepID=UPI001C27E90A|nr:CAAX prenyl protease 2-like [Salvia splendens]XP_042053768.1 CAAX prenyl protease 2-like [Salvia splendens]